MTAMAATRPMVSQLVLMEVSMMSAASC